MSDPFRQEFGFSSALSGPFQFASRPDPTQVVEFFEDFMAFQAGDWTVTETQASATQARIDRHGGWIALANSAADDDLNAIQHAFESIRFAPGRKAWFECRFEVSHATESDVVIGLLIRDTTPLDVTDGVFFIKADGAATVQFVAEKDSNQSTVSAVATLVADTPVRLGFFYDGRGEFRVFRDGLHVGSVTPGANLCDDEDLTFSIALQNGDANARTLRVDYLHFLIER